MSRAKMSLTMRVVMLALGICGAFMLLLSGLLLRFRAELYARHADAPKAAVETATSLVDAWAEREAKGELTREEAQRAALDALRHFRFESENYVWVNDLGPKMVMHPFKRDLEGQDLSTFADPTGKRLFLEMVQIARSPEQAGFVSYQWPKPGEERPVGKLSYVRLRPRWGWIIGAGVYTDDVSRSVSQIVWLLAALSIGVSIAMVVLSFWLAQRLGQPLEAALASLANGTTVVGETSRSVASVSNEIASGASSEAGALRESAQAITGVSTSTDANAKSASEAQRLIETAAASVDEANRLMASIVAQMGTLAALGQDTGRIVKTIDEISFQTNLLALNAAVEAARAGEAGAGFAVVAAEVRSLAQRAAEAAKSTAQLIEQTVQGIAQGRQLVERTSHDFAQVGHTIHSASQLMSSISQASDKQAAGIREVSQAISLLDRTTHQNASSAEQIAQSATQLSQRADALRRVVADIDELVRGQAA